MFRMISIMGSWSYVPFAWFAADIRRCLSFQIGVGVMDTSRFEQC
jgi:hypothetical protein